MAEDKNKQKQKQQPQPIRESVVRHNKSEGFANDSGKGLNVTTTLKPPVNPSRNGGDKKD